MTRTLVGLAAVTSVAVLAATHSQSRDTHHLETVTAIAVPNAAEAAANRSAQPPFSHDVEAHSRGVGPVTMLTTGSTKPRADNAATLASEKPDRNAQAALVRGIQAALFDARCYKGRINGVWSEKTRAAMSGFVGRVNAQLPVERPTFVLLTLIENQRGVRCPEPVRVVRQTTRDDIASATPQPPPPPVRAPARPAKTDQGSVKAAAEEDTMSASAQSPAQVQAQTQAKARVERNAGWVANSWRAAVAAAASRSGETGADENAHNTAQPKAAAPARADVVAAAQPKPPTKAVSAREAAPSGAADQKRGAADQKQGARLVVATARPSAYRPSMRVGNRPVDIVTVRPTATEAAIATKAGERVSNDAPRVAAATPPSGRDAADIDTADETHDGDPSVSIALPVRAPEPPPRLRPGKPTHRRQIRARRRSQSRARAPSRLTDAASV